MLDAYLQICVGKVKVSVVKKIRRMPTTNKLVI